MALFLVSPAGRLSTPHGTLGTVQSNQNGCKLSVLSTPHGTLGTPASGYKSLAIC